MLLDLVEVARSHSGVNLASAFAKILEEFGIADKVSSASFSEKEQPKDSHENIFRFLE